MYIRLMSALHWIQLILLISPVIFLQLHMMTHQEFLSGIEELGIRTKEIKKVSKTLVISGINLHVVLFSIPFHPCPKVKRNRKPLKGSLIFANSNPEDVISFDVREPLHLELLKKLNISPPSKHAAVGTIRTNN